MKIQIETMGDVAVLILTGEIDSRSNQQVDLAIKDVIASNIYKVVMDVAGMRFLGNQIVSKLISNLKELRAGGGDIKLVNPQRSVVHYLKQNRLFEFFEIYSTRSEAIRSFEITAESVQFNPVIEPVIDIAETTPSTSLSASQQLANQFETGEVLYANSCMLATLIRMLENKQVITAEEARELIEFGALSVPGEDE